MNVLLRVWPSRQSTNRVIDQATGVVWSGGHRLASKLAARRDVSAQNGQIICTRKANSLAVEADFEGDHISGERQIVSDRRREKALNEVDDVVTVIM